jgi:hypothetical protein
VFCVAAVPKEVVQAAVVVAVPAVAAVVGSRNSQRKV